MATLVLSTVGTLLGGPIGGAVGSLLGQSIDQQLFGPGPRHGPRLGDLSVQTSSYGTAIPQIFGKMRVAGSIIWSTDLQESSESEGAKGQPDTVTYSYSASFAVALSSRPISGIGRIWADGKLIRTADGEFAVSTGFRVWNGSQDQSADPLISSIEGMDSTPAYRGLSLAVFENIELAEFGNRIPFFTFEVEADPAPVAVGTILAEVSDGAINSSASAEVIGYAAHGASVAAAVEPIVKLCGVELFDDGSTLASPSSQLNIISDGQTGCSADLDPVPRLERTQVSASSLPAALSLSYYDPERDYQAGVSRASIDGRGRAVDRVELPAALNADAAKALAETSLARRWAQRDRLTLRVPAAHLPLRPGSLVRPPVGAGSWRVERVILDGLVVQAELRPLHSIIGAVPADSGRVLPSSEVRPSTTNIALVELPDDGTGQATSPVILVAAGGNGTTRRSIPLQVQVAGLEFSIRSASAPAIKGTAASVLPKGQSAVFDLFNTVEVELDDPEAWLESRDDDALAAGENLALLGSELLQFGDVVALGGRRFRLSRLLRARRGTEWAMSLHGLGDLFVILDAARLARVPVTSSQAGALLQVTPSGLADGGHLGIEAIVTGEALRPPSPVHLEAMQGSDGSLHCSWVRRSSLGWAWLDQVEVPLACSVEKYRVLLKTPVATLEIETGTPDAQFSAAELSSIGPGEAELSVVQVGDLAASRPASTLFTLT
ncbi:MAG TPA: phage tail protein [Sphingomicrobium sp.]|nr:phage tail protein [Sphingomicrobium sp.]